ncbi:MAG: GNAT family N-acetyltransferase [Eubacteriales bacterium]
MPTKQFWFIVWGKIMNNSEKITVHRARLDDADQIHRVVSESMQIYCKNSGIARDKLDASFETVEDIRSAISLVPFFVAVKPDGTIVGSVRLLHKRISEFKVPELAGILSMGQEEYVSYFSRFAVKEDLQGLGIGNLLYQASHAAAIESHSAFMLLHTALSNRIMVSFYEKRGFTLLFEDLSRGYPRGLFSKKI